MPGSRPNPDTGGVTGGDVSQSRKTPSLAGSFRYAGVAAAYAYRPPYPAEVFDVLDGLMTGERRHVLDIGAGDGALARPLAARVDWVDAVEISPAMVEAGRSRPGGRRANLVWHLEAAEELSLPGPYELVTAGASLHWMDWGVTLDRIGRVLAPGAMLAIVDQKHQKLDWNDRLAEVIDRYSRSPLYDPGFSLPDELRRLRLFEIHGRCETPPAVFSQPVRHYIEYFHSTASLARELMTPEEAARFGEEVESVVRDHQTEAGELVMHITASVVWGRPV
jgi:SAM-dependent methyltransferase